MKLLLAAVVLTIATSASAQVQTHCYDNGTNTVCQSFDTGAPQITPDTSTETIQYRNRTYQVQTTRQPVYRAPPSQGINWGLANSGTPPLKNPIDALLGH